MIDIRGLWPLVDERAAETPDALFAVGEQDRRPGRGAWSEAEELARRAYQAH